MLITVVSVLTVAASTAAKGSALDQFRLNRRSRAAGFSWRRELVAWSSYATWVAHGVIAGSRTEMLAQGLGVATSGALLAQVVYYRRTTTSPVEVTS